ncbi:hypothetical protein GCM10027346_12740 [Hymenobacter seoulensis]
METGSAMDATSGSSVSGAGSTGTNAGATSTSSTGISSPGTSGTMAISGSGGSNATDATGSAAGADINATYMASFATMQDPVFLMNAASSNMLEIQMGKMAVQKSTNADVKRYGQMMVDHHTKATQELQTVASPLGVTLPQTMLPVHQAMADRLMNKTGKDFDEAYMDAMETAHKMDIAMFEVKSSGAQMPAVKSFATKTLPMLRSHHTMADELEKKVD